MADCEEMAAEVQQPQQPQEQGPHLFVLDPLPALSRRTVEGSIDYFNGDAARASELRAVLNPGKKDVSLRLIDHLVVQYSRHHTIMISTDTSDVPVELWMDYRRALSNYGKRTFDIFKRKQCIRARLCGEEISTTAGQIVFMHWFLKRGLYRFLLDNLQSVRRHMQVCERGGAKKRKIRSPSKLEFVKPQAKMFYGTFKMTYA